MELTLDVGNRAHVLEAVLRHVADVAISGHAAGRRRASSPSRSSENRIACITAPDDPAALGEPLAAAELADRAWLLREPGSGTRALNEQFLAERGLTPRVLELGSNGAIKQAARAGLGISLVSRATVEAELAAGRWARSALRDAPPTPALVRPALRGGPVAAGRRPSSSHYLRATYVAPDAEDPATPSQRRRRDHRPRRPDRRERRSAPSATAARAVTSW